MRTWPLDIQTINENVLQKENPTRIKYCFFRYLTKNWHENYVYTTLSFKQGKKTPIKFSSAKMTSQLANLDELKKHVGPLKDLLVIKSSFNNLQVKTNCKTLHSKPKPNFNSFSSLFKIVEKLKSQSSVSETQKTR